MGYRSKGKRYRLVWPEDHAQHGLEIVTRGATVQTIMDASRAQTVVKRHGTLSPEGIEAVETMLGILASALIDWNFEDDDGNQVKADRAGLKQLDDDELLNVLTCWTKAVTGVDVPLGRPSTPIGKAPPIPMEPIPSMSDAL